MVIQDDYTETDPLANWFFSLDLKDAYFHIQIFTNLLVRSAHGVPRLCESSGMITQAGCDLCELSPFALGSVYYSCPFGSCGA